MIILSILMPTTPDRFEIFNKLHSKVMSQITSLKNNHATLGDVEVLVDDSKRFLDGGLSIGKKRQSLLGKAEGKYLLYLDSDESISPNYIETIVRLCHEDCDVVTFRSVAKLDNYWALIDMSLKYEFDEQARPDIIVRRRACHINAIRSEIAKRYVFPDTNYSEDSEWSEYVRYDLRTEAHTDEILHQYNHSSKHSEADKIIKAGYQ